MARNLQSNTISTEIFDAVFVCTGHYHETFIPDLEGLKDFEGRKMHSHSYRTPGQFENEKVLVVG